MKMKVLFVDDEKCEVSEICRWLELSGLIDVRREPNYGSLGKSGAGKLPAAVSDVDLCVLDALIPSINSEGDSEGQTASDFLGFLRLIAGIKPFIVYTSAAADEGVFVGQSRYSEDELSRVVYQYGGMKIIRKARAESGKLLSENEVIEAVMQFYWCAFRAERE